MLGLLIDSSDSSQTRATGERCNKFQGTAPGDSGLVASEVVEGSTRFQVSYTQRPSITETTEHT